MVEKKKAKAESVQRAKTFLVKAINKNDPKTLERIMKAGYPIEEPIQAYGGVTPLMFAVTIGQQEVIEMLFQCDPDLGTKDSAGRTVLHHVCRGGNL